MSRRLTPDEIQHAIETGDVAALGRAQAAGQDIRPRRPEPEPVAGLAGQESTVGDFLFLAAFMQRRWQAGLRAQVDAPEGGK